MSVQRSSFVLSSPSLCPYSLGNQCLKSSTLQLKGGGGTQTQSLHNTFCEVSTAVLSSTEHRHLTAEVQILTEIRDGSFLCSQMQRSQHHPDFTARLDSFLSNLYYFMYSPLLSNALSIPLRKYPVAPDEPIRKGRGSSRVG